jgi:hypothetical protein
MVITNKLDKIFGPIGSIAGIVILLFGLFSVYYSLTGLITVFVGAFLAFTTTSAKIDVSNKRVKFSSDILGFISVGHWTEIKPEMKLGIVNSNKVHHVNSQSNRGTDVSEKDFRIMLYTAGNKEFMPLKKFYSQEIAKKELPELANMLGLGLV